MQMIPTEETQKIINDFVKKAKAKDTIESHTVVHVDFSKMSDKQIGQWLVDKAKLIDARNGEIADADVREAYKAGYMEEAWNNLVDSYLYDGLYDLYESKKHKKFSSFKNQQTITESFRRFLKK